MQTEAVVLNGEEGVSESIGGEAIEQRFSSSNLLFLALARLVSSLGSSMFNFALSLYVLDLTGSSAIFSMVLSAAILPSVIVNLAGGVLIDRFSKKQILILSEILSGVLTILFFLFFVWYPESITTLVVFAILLSVVQSFFILAVHASIPEIIQEEKVAAGNSILRIIHSRLMIVGPVAGAVAYSSLGMKAVIVLNGASFILGGVAMVCLKFKPMKERPSKPSAYWSELRESFTYLKTQPVLKFLLWMLVSINFLFVPMMVLVIPYINYQVLEVSGFQLAIIEGSFGLGAMLGGIYISVRKDSQKFIRKAFLLLGLQCLILILLLFPIAIPQADKAGITLGFSLLLVLLGAINMVQNIPLFTYFQLRIPEALRGRVLGLINVGILLSTPLGLWVYGLLLENFSWYYITTGSGLIILAICLTQRNNIHFQTLIQGLKK